MKESRYLLPNCFYGFKNPTDFIKKFLTILINLIILKYRIQTSYSFKLDSICGSEL